MTQLSTRPSIGGDKLQARRRGGGSPKLSYVDAVKIDHPEVLWPLDDAVGSLTARDLSGSDNAGTVATGHQRLVFGAPGYTTDGATALQQTSSSSGSNPAAITNALASVGTGNHAFTLECAAGSILAANSPSLVGIGGVNAAQQFWFMRIDATSIVLRTLGNGWSWLHGVTPTDATMHNYCITYDGAGTPHGYVDGVDRGAPLVSGTPAPNIQGVGIFANGNARADDGDIMVIADVAVYDHALTAAQIAAHVAAR